MAAAPTTAATQATQAAQATRSQPAQPSQAPKPSSPTQSQGRAVTLTVQQVKELLERAELFASVDMRQERDPRPLMDRMLLAGPSATSCTGPQGEALQIRPIPDILVAEVIDHPEGRDTWEIYDGITRATAFRDIHSDGNSLKGMVKEHWATLKAQVRRMSRIQAAQLAVECNSLPGRGTPFHHIQDVPFALAKLSVIGGQGVMEVDEVMSTFGLARTTAQDARWCGIAIGYKPDLARVAFRSKLSLVGRAISTLRRDAALIGKRAGKTVPLLDEDVDAIMTPVYNNLSSDYSKVRELVKGQLNGARATFSRRVNAPMTRVVERKPEFRAASLIGKIDKLGWPFGTDELHQVPTPALLDISSRLSPMIGYLNQIKRELDSRQQGQQERQQMSQTPTPQQPQQTPQQTPQKPIQPAQPAQPSLPSQPSQPPQPARPGQQSPQSPQSPQTPQAPQTPVEPTPTTAELVEIERSGVARRS